MILVQCDKPYIGTPCIVQKELRGTHDLGDERKGEIGGFFQEEIRLKENIENGHG